MATTASGIIKYWVYNMFDVVITTYKRPDLAFAAVSSCLMQGDLLDNVILVDDGSDDDTVQKMRKVEDKRLIILERALNGGIAAARRDGYALSEAEWTISLDSDHELLPNALICLNQLIRNQQCSVDILGGRYIWDTGEVTPQVVPLGIVDYKQRICLSGRPNNIGSDYVCVISRKLRKAVLWEPLRSSLPDMLFQLDIANIGNAVFTNEIIALEKTVGDHSWTRGSAEARWNRRCQDAGDGLMCIELIITRHGLALQKYDKMQAYQLFIRGAFYAILSNCRFESWCYLIKAIRVKIISSDCLMLLLCSIIPVRLIKFVYINKDHFIKCK